jgi:hypothetical protein
VKAFAAKLVVASVGLVVWGIGRYAARRFETFSWPQEISLLIANIGLIVIGTAIVLFLWDLLRELEGDD